MWCSVKSQNTNSKPQHDGRALWREAFGDHCLIVGEVAQAHDGSLGMAHAFIDAIADAGADGVKFQAHIANAESTLAEPWRIQFSKQDASRYDYWKRMEFTVEQWIGLKQHAAEKGLRFLSSPFSLEAAEMLERVGVPAWKVASGEVTNTPLLNRLVKTKLPMILSSGMSSIEELDGAVAIVQSENLPLAVLQCTTAYPCPPEKVGLNMMQEFRTRYGCAVGLSDHSATIYAGLAAASLGADVIEVHVTLSREMFGPDVVASLTTVELKQLVDGVRFIEKMLSNPVSKQQITDAEEARRIFSKSIVARQDLASGTLLTEEHLSFKKPGFGMPASEAPRVIGRRLKRDLQADELILEKDLEVED